MADRITKEQRSRNMSAVKSRGNKSTEEKFLTLLRTNKISGWRRHYRPLVGTPDFVFPQHKLAVFLDGCFWHGCRCSELPKTNRIFWEEKINGNKKRDKDVIKELSRLGWKVLRIKEHQLKNLGVIPKLVK